VGSGFASGVASLGGGVGGFTGKVGSFGSLGSSSGLKFGL